MLMFIVYLIITASGFQIPFFNSPVHYSSLDPSSLPINLTQYEDFTVIRIEHSDDLRNLILKNRSRDWEVWSKSNLSNTVDLKIRREDLDLLTMKYQVIIDDLAQTVYDTYPPHYNNDTTFLSLSTETVNETSFDIFSELFFKEYRPLQTIDAWLDLLQQSFPDLVSIEVIGQTFEGRPYKVIHVSNHNVPDPNTEKKTVVITGGVHAREWISVSSVCYQLYKVLQTYATDINSPVMEKLDFLFIPVSNPDGYEYSWNVDRLWRKNRQKTIIPECYGIDIDHSYDFHWLHSIDWPCGEEYSGERPFEALELKIWEEYLNKTNDHHEIYGYVDLHSYSQEILVPFAYSCNEDPRDEENLLELAYGIAKAIRQQSGKYYGVLPACQDKDSYLSPELGSGTGLDFMYHNKAYWAYQLKLRDSGNHGFLLPPKFIEPVGMEVFAGMRYFCEFILTE